MWSIFKRVKQVANNQMSLELNPELQALRTLALWWLGVSIAMILAYAASFTVIDSSGPRLFEPVALFAVSLIVAVCALVIGALMGFLFGIPRTIQSEVPTQGGTGRVDSDFRLNVNTNLEQISDWLTKIIVGVGLTQLEKIPSNLLALAEHLKPVMGDNVVFPLAVVLNFSGGGFLSGYLTTRLNIAVLFKQVGLELAGMRLQEAISLSDQGAHRKAIARYEKAKSELTPTTPAVVKREIYEGLIYSYLFETEEKGYEKVIQYANEYMNSEPSFPSAKIYANLAAAYGQQYKVEQDTGKPQTELDAIRDKAYAAAEQAVKLEPLMKYYLQAMWSPDHPNRTEDDDDLIVFLGDPKFVKLLT